MAGQPADKTREKVLVGAGSFTGLWALTWLGATAAGAGPAIQGGFAVGGVMASSGLTALWWNVAALRQLEKRKAKAQADADAASASAEGAAA